MALLNNDFFPITTHIGFLEADLETVIQADRSGRLSDGGYKVSHLSDSFPKLLERLLPLTGPSTRNVWIQTAGKWTAYFDNFRIGGDPYGPICHGARHAGCRGVMIVNSPQTPTWWGGRRFTVFNPDGPRWRNITREISAINNGGRWNWTISGNPQSFEELSRYQARRIKDRLTPEMLERYCAALGIQVFDESFYGDQGYLVENANSHPSRVTTESLDAVKNIAGV